MKQLTSLTILLVWILGALRVAAQTGPFDPENWPATKKANSTVHYTLVDGGLEAPSGTWLENELILLSGGDQATTEISIGGHRGLKVIGNYLNIADKSFEFWGEHEFIDVLVQAYGDGALFNANGSERNFNFLTGTLPFGPPPFLAFPVGGRVPVEARNKKWNWILFRVPNGTRPDGQRFVGPVASEAQGATTYGGVNGGTLRIEGVPGLIVRAVAFGEPGAFGEPEDINKFFGADVCEPEPQTNLAGIDIQRNTATKVEVINSGDQKVVFEDGVGPATDKRRAVRPTGLFLNFGILDSYLGRPCNDPRLMKVCVDYFDDPALIGVKFGPEAYATDDKGGIAIYPVEKRQVLAGTGKWVRRSWLVPSVNLFGVNAGATHTAGPRFISEGGAVAVSRFDIAVIRVGSHPLAGQDPLAECVEDLNICTDAYGSLAELDLAKDVKNGLDVGTSGGDQNMIVEEGGPANDRRLAIRAAHDDGTPGFSHQYLNFAITGEALGPNSQPPAQLAVCATYYDDPELVGKRFKPEVYITENNGVNTFAFTPESFFVTLEGTGKWREAYWEIPNVKFNGVNQGPQAAARFATTGKILVTSLRYAVIRPCGPKAGVNLLAACKPAPPEVNLTVTKLGNGSLKLSWPEDATGFVLQSTESLTALNWQSVAGNPVAEGDQLTVTVVVDGTRFYRLVK